MSETTGWISRCRSVWRHKEEASQRQNDTSVPSTRWLRRLFSRGVLAVAATCLATGGVYAEDEPWWSDFISFGPPDRYQAGPGYEWYQGPEAGHHGPYHLPPVIGSYSRGPGESTLRFPADRVIVTNLNVPVGGVLTSTSLTAATPVGTSPLTLNPGSGTFNILGSTSNIFDVPPPLTAQQLQAYYRVCTGNNPYVLEGTVASEDVISSLAVNEINAAFAATGQPYDLVGVTDPSANIQNAVDGVFDAANSVEGTTVFDSSTSAAIRSKDTETTGTLNGPVNAGDLFDVLYAFDYVVDLAVPSPSADGLLGRTTVATNGAVRTTNRLFFDYAVVNNALPTSRAESIDRFTLAWERTFGEGHFSLEGRIAMAAPLDNRIVLETGMGPSQTEFGNMLLIAKQELYVDDWMVVSGGLGMSLPTGSDVNVDNAAGIPLLSLDNESTHFKPFLAAIYVPDHHWFFQGFIEYDIAGGTNTAAINLDGLSLLNRDGGRAGLQKVGRYRDASHLLVDVQAGYWFGEVHDDHGHDDHGGGHGHGHGHDDREDEWSWMPRRWAPIVEFHFDQGMSDASVLRGNSFRITDISQDRELLNVLVGGIFDMGHDKTVSVAYVDGVGGDGSAGDGELRVVLNWPFDPR